MISKKNAIRISLLGIFIICFSVLGYLFFLKKYSHEIYVLSAYGNMISIHQSEYKKLNGYFIEDEKAFGIFNIDSSILSGLKLTFLFRESQIPDKFLTLLREQDVLPFLKKDSYRIVLIVEDPHRGKTDFYVFTETKKAKLSLD